MTNLERTETNLPARDGEADAIGRAASENASFDKLLKFKKGDYYCDGEEIPMGTQYVAHVVGWTKCWIKFIDGAMVERKLYSVGKRQYPPDSSELDNNDESKWGIGPNGLPSDPWVFQYLLPLEHVESGDIVVFTTPSVGGKRAVDDLCNAYYRRYKREGTSHMPIVALREAKMPSKKWGDVPRPYFEIIGWEGVKEGIRETQLSEKAQHDMNDSIPF